MLILSLGAGVQSTTLLLLSAKGVIPKYDAAIFSDTGWEPKEVYEHLDRIEKEIAEPAGIPIYRVSHANIKEDHLNGKITMPLYSPNSKKPRMITRRCTGDYKLKPIRRQIRILNGAKVSSRGQVVNSDRSYKAVVDIGISLDEIQRAKDSPVKYIVHQFSLLDMKWTRDDCVRYLAENGYGETPRSSCVVCPFRSNPNWLEIKTNKPEQWEEAVAFDKAIIEKTGYYVHGQRVPLDQVDLTRKRGRPRRESCSPFSCVADMKEPESP